MLKTICIVLLLFLSQSQSNELLVLKFKLSTNFSLTICYRTSSAPAPVVVVFSELLPYISSEYILVGHLNWDMINPADMVLQQFDALNLSQIISEPTDPTPNLLHPPHWLTSFLLTPHLTLNLESLAKCVITLPL